jgi:hypothetical protein
MGMRLEQEGDMWWQEVLWGFWNGLSAWVVLIVHVFGGWHQYPFFDNARAGNWYDLGFLMGAGSPLFGVFGAGKRTTAGVQCGRDSASASNRL